MTQKVAALVLALVAATVLAGAKGCSVWAETDQSIYDVGKDGTATLHNDGFELAYLPGCSTFSYEKLDGGTWTDQGPDVVCVWEGIVRPLEKGQALSTTFRAKGEGTWRLRFTVAYGCTPGKPMSQAGCASTESVSTPEFEVTAQPTTRASCDDLTGIDFGACEMFVGYAVVGGKCAGVSGCSGRGHTFFTTEVECLKQCDTDCSMWRAAYDREVESISTCTSASECAAVPRTSCGCTRDLPANTNIDKTQFWTIQAGMNQAGCGMVTTCDCPVADGFLCKNGHCAWNYRN